MNNVILDLMPKSGGLPVGGATSGAVTKAGTSLDAELFRKTFEGRLRSVTAAVTPRRTARISADGIALQALQTKIGTMIEAGASQADVVTALAAQLASSVAKTLETPGADARGKLQTVFATALAPPGCGDPESAPVADRALSLAQRFTRLANLASAIAGQASGQQNKSAGNVLDAHRAKDIPAPTTTVVPVSFGLPSPAAAPTSISTAPAPTAATRTQTTTERVSVDSPSRAAPLTGAASAPASIVPVSVGLSSQAAPIANGSGDARTVKLGSKTAIATDGDTTLGRILTRAALAADARQEPIAPSSDDSTDLADSTDSAPAAATTGSVESNPMPSDAVSILVKTLEAVLSGDASADAAQPTQHDALSATLLSQPYHGTADASLAFLPPIAPFTIEHAVPVAAPAPAATPMPVDQSAIADQVLRGAFMRNVGESSEIRLTLAPKSLGDVMVKLVVSAGSVTARVLAETPEVRDALVAAQPQLTKGLADAGLKLTSFSVDLSGGGFAQQQNNQPQSGNRSRSWTSSAETDGGIDETLLEAIPSFGSSNVARSSTGNHNYLA